MAGVGGGISEHRERKVRGMRKMEEGSEGRAKT